MRLQFGDTAPPFETITIDGRPIRLKGFLPGPMDGDKTRIPGDFLIDPDLIIQTAYYGKDIGDHLPLTDIHQWLEQRSPRKDDV